MILNENKQEKIEQKDFKTILLNILLKKLMPGGLIISVLGQLFNNNYNFSLLISYNFLNRFLISMIFIVILAFILSWLRMNFDKEKNGKINNLNKYKYILIEDILGFGFPLGIIMFIFELDSYSFSLQPFAKSVLIGLLIGLIYGLRDWIVFKKSLNL